MNRKEIKMWLIRQDLTQAQIAKESGVSKALVCMTIKGERRSAEVMKILREHGMPEELLLDECKEAAV